MGLAREYDCLEDPGTTRDVAVGFLYHSESGKVLLHLRGENAPPNPGRWAFFGGRAEPEDHGDLLLTWLREMQEELGIILDAGQVILLRNGSYDNGIQWHEFVYSWTSLRDQFELTEGQRYAWFTIPEALELSNLADYARESLELFQGRW